MQIFYLQNKNVVKDFILIILKVLSTTKQMKFIYKKNILK